MFPMILGNAVLRKYSECSAGRELFSDARREFIVLSTLEIGLVSSMLIMGYSHGRYHF
jgi:hypothetical protein